MVLLGSMAQARALAGASLAIMAPPNNVEIAFKQSPELLGAAEMPPPAARILSPASNPLSDSLPSLAGSRKARPSS